MGRAKVRQRRPWFSKKFYDSFMNIKEFMADSLGREFLGIVSDAIGQRQDETQHRVCEIASMKFNSQIERRWIRVPAVSS